MSNVMRDDVPVTPLRSPTSGGGAYARDGQFGVPQILRGDAEHAVGTTAAELARLLAARRSRASR
jgi:hypothetical protein